MPASTNSNPPSKGGVMEGKMEYETIILTGRDEWAAFVADNADSIESTDDALIAALTDGYVIGGGSAPLFLVRIVNAA